MRVLPVAWRSSAPPDRHCGMRQRCRSQGASRGGVAIMIAATMAAGLMGCSSTVSTAPPTACLADVRSALQTQNSTTADLFPLGDWRKSLDDCGDEQQWQSAVAVARTQLGPGSSLLTVADWHDFFVGQCQNHLQFNDIPRACTGVPRRRN